MKSLASIFPNASASTLAVNTHLQPKKRVQGNVERKKGKRGVMNKTEIEYALILRSQFEKGEILRYEYEGITLHWADMRYTPDFVVFLPTFHNSCDQPLHIKLIEVKGGHIWDRDIVRFKGARAYWPEFQFELHQKTKSGWKRKF